MDLSIAAKKSMELTQAKMRIRKKLKTMNKHMNKKCKQKTPKPI